MSVDPEIPQPLFCQRCSAHIEPVTFRDGTQWSIDQLVSYGQQRFDSTLCMECYRSSNKIRRRQRAAEKRTRTTWDVLSELKGYVATLRRAEEAIAEARAEGTALAPEVGEHASQVLDLVTARIERILETTESPS
jgi:hypothetical protein